MKLEFDKMIRNFFNTEPKLLTIDKLHTIGTEIQPNSNINNVRLVSVILDGEDNPRSIVGDVASHKVTVIGILDKDVSLVRILTDKGFRMLVIGNDQILFDKKLNGKIIGSEPTTLAIGKNGDLLSI